MLRRPWTMAGQAHVLEPWRSGFFSAKGAISKALVWVRLLRLLTEYWDVKAIPKMGLLTGELVSLDECTMDMRQLGFARACIKIDLGRPLQPKVLVKGPVGPFWQHFVFEYLDRVCLHCGHFHMSEERCRPGEGAAAAGLGPDNLFRLEEVDGDLRAVGPPWALAAGRPPMGVEAEGWSRREKEDDRVD